MKSDNSNNDDLITYNIDGVGYSFKSNPAMIDIFKSIIETLPLQKSHQQLVFISEFHLHWQW
jgi:hypothetical protein